MKALVVGKSKTGTTAVSKALEQSLGQADYYLEPKSLAFFCQPIKDPANLVVKILYEPPWTRRLNLLRGIICNEWPLNFDRIVFTIRDPRDEFISRLHYFVSPYIEHQNYREGNVDHWLNLIRAKEAEPSAHSVIMMARAAEELFPNIDLVDAQFRLAKRYYNLIRTLPDNCFVMRYENFIQNQWSELSSYLGMPVRFDGNVGRDLAKTKRSSSCDNWKRYFTDEDLAVFREKLGQEMEQLGYNDAHLTPCDSLDPISGSRYVETIIEEARGVRRKLSIDRGKQRKGLQAVD